MRAKAEKDSGAQQRTPADRWSERGWLSGPRTHRANTFVYADPPYFEKAGSLYMNYFKADDHAALAKDLNAKAAGYWLLTYDAVPQVDTLYAERRIRRFGLTYSAHRVTKATELAVLSDSLIDIGEGWPL